MNSPWITLLWLIIYTFSKFHENPASRQTDNGVNKTSPKVAKAKLLQLESQRAKHNEKTSVQSNMTNVRIAVWRRMDSTDFDPIYITHGSLDPHDSAPKRAYDRFSGFCPTDTLTTLRATSISIGRIACMRCGRYFMTSEYSARWRGGATGRTLDLRSTGRGFKSLSEQSCVTTLGKLFTPMCLCHQAV